MDLQTDRGQTEESDFIGLTLSTQKMDGNDLSSGQYSVNKNIRFTTSMLGSNLCCYNDAYCCKRDDRSFSS